MQLFLITIAAIAFTVFCFIVYACATSAAREDERFKEAFKKEFHTKEEL